MFYIILDTCVLLDISTKKQDLPLVSALEELVKCGTVKLVITDLVAEEYEVPFDRLNIRYSDKYLTEYKKDLCTRQISQNPYPIRILPS